MEQGWGLTFEYTSPHSPQYNGRLERKIATLYTRLRASLTGAGLPSGLRTKLWAECANYVTRLENITVSIRRDGKFVPYHRMWGTNITGLEHMRIFGEIGIVNFGSTKKIQAKLKDKGRACIHLGQATNHTTDTYRFIKI